MHGIYAGDVWQLSARTLLANAWKLEGLYGSVWRGMIRLQQESPVPEQVSLYHPHDMDALKAMREDIKLEDKFVEQLGESAMFSFRNGLQEMVKALQRKLEENNQVRIMPNSPVESYNMAKGAGQRVEVVTGVSLFITSLQPRARIAKSYPVRAFDIKGNLRSCSLNPS